MDKNQLTEQLMTSVLMEDFSEIKRLVDAGADIDSLGVNNRNTIVTPLGRACLQGSREVAQELIKLGADINLSDTTVTSTNYMRISSPIILAMQNGYDDIVKDLIKAGANLEAIDKNGDTVLFIAVKENKADLVKDLIKAGAKLSSDNHGINILGIATKNNNEEIIKDLLDAGAKSHDSISSIAFKEGHIKLAKNLIEKGYPFNKYPTPIETLFLNAFYKEKVENCISNPSILNDVDKNGETLLLTLTKNNLSDLAFKLIKAGAKVENADKEGNTALINAAYYNDDNLVKALVDAGANVNAVNSEGKSALLLTDRGFETLSMLIKAGANINQQDKDGNTALMKAVSNNNSDVVSFFIDAGANINAQDKKGRTALMLTAKYANAEEMTGMLLEAGADMDIVDKGGRNVLNHGTYHGRCEVIDLIKQKEKENSPEGIISKILGLRKTKSTSALKNTQ